MNEKEENLIRKQKLHGRKTINRPACKGKAGQWYCVNCKGCLRYEQ